MRQAEKQLIGSVEYHKAGQKYFDKRGLKRYAGSWSLWALGVGAVIAGDFSGWNLGVGQGGFGGFLLAGHGFYLRIYSSN